MSSKILLIGEKDILEMCVLLSFKNFRLTSFDNLIYNNSKNILIKKH